MKRLRAILIADPGVVLATIIYGIISLLYAPFDRTGERMLRLARTWARTLIWISGVKVQIEGLENLALGSNYVFISNHLSYTDTPVILASIPVQFRFLAKKGLFSIPLLGHHLKQAGHIAVPLDDPRGSIRTLQLAAEAVQQKKISLLIFPEGGRSEDSILQEFKDGAAYIAIRAGVPIVPIALIGTDRLLPFGGGLVMPGEVTLRILPPIPTLAMKPKDRTLLTEQLHELIRQQVQQATPELELSGSRNL